MYISIKANCFDCFSSSLYDLTHHYFNNGVQYICMLDFIYKQHSSFNGFNIDSISLYME